MKKTTYKFSSAKVDYFFDGRFSDLKKIVDKKRAIILTDENVFEFHQKQLKGWDTIVLKPGEKYKTQATVDSVIQQLMVMEADRQTILVGVGGGVITDITGFVASIYMRGINFGFVPTTVLGMVDAAIGGKNGIDVGNYKNMIGVFRQPSFILYDTFFLTTLPHGEWQNGFAEIIKHSCIRDAAMFKQLESGSIKYYQEGKTALSVLIRRNALLKTKIVQDDELEKDGRRLLNFGHTLGHAIENQYQLSHGQAISIGMAYATVFSEKLAGFREKNRVTALLRTYGLPATADLEGDKVVHAMIMDKKRESKEINYILLEKIGRGIVRRLPLNKLQSLVKEHIE